MSTKAIHVELVTELTSDAFLAALKRFVSRRGICYDIYSDNGTNFVGANGELKSLKSLLDNSNFSNYLTRTEINWHFIPPHSPHFGGLWEAAVKSIKSHLKRVLANQALTYEEFYTMLTQIEASLNSRPLIPLSSDPHDLEALTPGHFLIGGPLSAIPQRDLINSATNLTKRYLHITKMFQQVWQRWSHDYLHHLQQRSKWQSETTSKLRVGSMVLLREDNTPPLCWCLGRVLEVHPGSDGQVRVATIKTCKGIFKRALTKLSLLPNQQEDPMQCPSLKDHSFNGGGMNERQRRNEIDVRNPPNEAETRERDRPKPEARQPSFEKESKSTSKRNN